MNTSHIAANESAAHPVLRTLRIYGLAVLSVVVALGLALCLQQLHFQDGAVPLLLFAVAIASWYGGRGPAALAAILSIGSLYWYFVEPVRTVEINASEIPYFIIFAAFASLISWFATIRRRAEAVLREQASLLDLTHDTVLAMDMKGVIKYWNRGAEERYGWTAEQAVGRVVHDLLKTVPPAPIEQIRGQVTRKGHWEGELVHTTRDGTHIVVASRWSLQRDERGVPVAILDTNNDITERKQVEEALHRSNRELRAISNCNQILLRATDEQSLLEQICRIICDEADYRPVWVSYIEHDEAKSVRPVAWAGTERTYLDQARISWSEDTERGRGPTGIAIRSGKSCCVQDFATEDRVAPWRDLLLPSGFRSAIALPLKDEHANVFGALTMHSDRPNAFTPDEVHLLEELAGDLAFGIVTLRSRAAREPAEQEIALLGFALDNVHEAALLIDEQGRFHYVNEEACRALGYSRADLLDMAVPDIDLEVRAERWLELKTRRPLSFKSRYRTRDGRIFPVEVSENYFEYGGKAYCLALVRDITEAKRTEEALKRIEAYLAEAQRLSHTGSWAFDVAGHEYIYLSDECVRMFGLDPKAPLPTREAIFRLIHPNDSERVNRDFRKSVDERVDTSSEFRIALPKGTMKHIQTTRHPVSNDAGEVFEVVGTVVDITERKRGEEERERLRQLEADLAHMNRVSMMGELAASIAHEVNQPLAGVVSNASAGLRWLAADVPNLDEARQGLRRIVRDGKRAGEVIQRIRALTKKTAAAQQKLDLNQTIGEVLALVDGQAKKNRVTMTTGFAHDLSPVFGDPIQLQQVVLNLVMNAIEAMSGAGERQRELVVTTRHMEPDQVQVTVQDSGVGIDPERMDKIFDSFYTTKPGGMGMGLSIGRSILQAHEGRLWATANNGPGASFHFTLPKHHEEKADGGAAGA